MPALRLWLLPLVLSLGWLLACATTGPERKRVRMPREGVALAFRLSPGQALEGTLEVGTTRRVEGKDESIGQSVSVEVRVVALGEAEGAGLSRLRVRLSDAELTWEAPPPAELSADALAEQVDARLAALQIDLEVDRQGRVVALRRPPASGPPEVDAVIDALVDGVDAMFVPVPSAVVHRGDDYRAAWARAADGLSGELTGSVDGTFLLETSERTVVVLRVRHARTRETSPPEESRGTTLLMFSPAGYPVRIDRESEEFGDGVAYRKVLADLELRTHVGPDLVGGTAPEEEEHGDVQLISDPCHPDYVGPNPCTEAPGPESGPEPGPGPGPGPEPEPEPKPEPKSEPKPKPKPERGPTPEPGP